MIPPTDQSQDAVPPPRVLYIASGGINEPLIVSQVLRYLKRLSGTYETCHLITLERDTPTDAAAIANRLAQDGIHWQGLPAHGGMRVINLWREIYAGYQTGLKLIKEHRLNLIHARSFIPGNIGLRLAKKTNTKLLYDMRGFWADEKKAKGTIKSGWLFRRALAMESRLFHHADALVSLTEAGKQKLIGDGVKTRIHIIPCCADTDLFRPADQPSKTTAESSLRLISVGSLGAGYLPSAVFGLFKAASEVDPNASLQLLTRSDQSAIQKVAEEVGCDWNQVKVDSAKPDQVVDYLNQANVGLCMIGPSSAKLASSPTKLAEYLACGLPVIANANMIGDVGEILRQHRVGVIADDFSPAGFQAAIAQLKTLLTDPELAARCRQTAIKHFSVDVAVARYAAAYRQLMGVKAAH